MRSLMKAAFIGLAAVALAGCGQTYKNIAPNKIAEVLTPSGYEGKIYTPGQVDIGQRDNDGRGNQLVLIERSGVSPEEQFREPGASTEVGEMDNSDHRCLTKDQNPMTLDVRLILALPDYETEQGQKDLQRLFLLGNPQPVEGEERVLEIKAADIYEQFAKQDVRRKVRQICAQYTDYNAAFESFSSNDPDSFNGRIEKAVGEVLKERNVPMRLVSAAVSNMKPDAAIINAGVLKKSAEMRKEAMDVIVQYLANDPNGSKRLVYTMQTWGEIVAKANANGHNTIFMTTIPGQQVVPLH